MPVYIGLLRAVNLGGNTQVSMEALRSLLSRMGLADVRTVLQSGNAVFTSDETNEGKLEKRLEDRTEKELGLRTDFFVRTADEWDSIVRGNPYRQEERTSPNHLVVTVLKEVPPNEGWTRLDSAIRGPERVKGRGRHAYIVYPDGIGRSRLTAAVIEKNLGTRGTSRNWNTVLKLAAIAASAGAANRAAH